MKNLNEEEDEQTADEWLAEELANAQARDQDPNAYKARCAIASVVSTGALVASFGVVGLLHQYMLRSFGRRGHRGTVPFGDAIRLFEFALALDIAVGLLSLIAVAITARGEDSEPLPERARVPYVLRVFALAALVIAIIAGIEICSVLLAV